MRKYDTGCEMGDERVAVHEGGSEDLWSKRSMRGFEKK